MIIRQLLAVLLLLTISACSKSDAPPLTVPTTSDKNARNAKTLISVRPARLDLGTVLIPTASIESKFAITNLSDQQLKLSNLISSCGCTVARPDSTTLDPGESLTVNVTVRPAQSGRGTSVVKAILCRADDKDFAATELELIWEGRTRFSVEPSRIDAGSLNPGKEWKGTVQLQGHDGTLSGAFVESLRTVPADRVAAKLDSSTGKLSISIRPSTTVGRFNAVITLECGEGVGPLQIPVTWQVEEKLSMVPKAVFRNAEKLGTAWVANFIVRSRNEKIVAINPQPIDHGVETTCKRVNDTVWTCQSKGEYPNHAGPYSLLIPVTVDLEHGQTHDLQFKLAAIVAE